MRHFLRSAVARLCVFCVCCGHLAFPAASGAAAPAPPQPRVVVLYGTEGRTAGDQRYNKVLGDYLVRWIDECGIAATNSPDTTAAQALKPPCSVAWFLGVNNPSAPVLKALDAFLKRGGKIIAVNCHSQEIGDRLGFKVKGFRTAPGFATWTGLRFEGKRPLFAPEELPMVISAITESSAPWLHGAKTRAKWVGSNGKATPYAAVLSHDNGFCITAPLSGSASPSARRLFLLSLLGELSPPLWTEAANTLRTRLNAEAFLRKPPNPVATARAEFDATLAEARVLHGAAEDARAKKLTATATLKLLSLAPKLDLLRAYAQPPWNGAVRAVWDQTGYGFEPGHWEQTCARLERAGITDLFLLTATPTWTHATVPGLAPSPLRKAHGDQLTAAVKAAHSHHLRVHAWIAAYGLMNPTASEIAEFHKAGRLLVGADGKPMPYLNPRVAANSARIVDTALHLSKNYAIDGIHLDYIRYGTLPETPTAAERARFETTMRKKAAQWPADVMPNGKLRADYLAYRRYAIGGTVKTLREKLRAAAPNVKLSAAVYGSAVKAKDNVGQDWISWLSNDYLDWALPMNYAATDATFAKILDDQKCSSSIRRKIVSGIGITAAECDLSAAAALRQIETVRKRGYGGYALFDLDAKLLDEILPVLEP